MSGNLKIEGNSLALDVGYGLRFMSGITYFRICNNNALNDC